MNVLITGAGKGIGLELVKQFSKKGANNIIALSRNVDRLKSISDQLSKKNTDLHYYPIDFLSPLFKEQIKDIINSFNFNIDILINNAGLLSNKPFTDYEVEEIKEMYQVNVFSPLQLVQVLINKQANEECHVVSIGSMGGYQGSAKFPGLSIYSSSKAAMANITECLAEEYKNTRFKFNCLALGSVQTEMFSEAFPEFQAQLFPEQIAEYIVQFSLSGGHYYNGKILPVSKSTP